MGASVEFCAYPGAPDAPVPWDPMRFSELYKVSGNNPDVAFLREAELKHGRLSMLAFAGILATNGDPALLRGLHRVLDEAKATRLDGDDDGAVDGASSS